MSMSTSAVMSGSGVSEGVGLVLPEYPKGLSVLVVDDDADVRDMIAKALRKFSVPVLEVECLDQAREKLVAGEKFSMVFLDKCLPDGDGVDFSREIMKLQPGLAVCIVTGQGNSEDANNALDGGVFDYIPKPCHVHQIRDAFLRIFPALSAPLDDGVAIGIPVGGLGGDADVEEGVKLIAYSNAMIRVALEVREIARMSASCLIYGETGTGKEVIAKRIHEMSGRANGKFVAVNCGAIPHELIESELFGYVKGAFTGAAQDRKGKFEEADGGTIFLDEITETTPAFQVKLLRVLQEHCITRVGSNQEIQLNVRVIASSNRDVLDEVSAGRFRQDLYFRLEGSKIFLPRLKDRREDIVPLALYFAGRAADNWNNENKDKKRQFVVSMAVLEALKRYSWPGNVRELEQKMESAVQRSNGTVLLSELPREMRVIVGDLSKYGVALVGTSEEFLPLEDVEAKYCLEVLRYCNGNKSRAADILGVERTQFGKKCRAKGWDKMDDGEDVAEV